MTVTEYARRDGVNPVTARMKARQMDVGTWVQGLRSLTENEWRLIQESIRPSRGRPRKED